MPIWRSWLLNLYYYGSYPWRRAAERARGAEGRAPVVVLFYHRVANRDPNPWTVSSAAFARQIRWLKRHFEIVTLSEAQARIRSGFQTRTSVAITFDDGYADNCRHAFPCLFDERIPFTYFVTTRNVITGESFPHDRARNCPLAPNSVEQIRELARAGVELGAHTRSHPDLGQLHNADQLYDEVVGGRDELEQISGARVRYFAFPFGQVVNLNRQAFRIARDAGFAGVCSAYGGFNFPGDDAFHLQRIPADESMVRLKNWVTLDPRKLRASRRYDTGLDATLQQLAPAGASV